VDSRRWRGPCFSRVYFDRKKIGVKEGGTQSEGWWFLAFRG